MRTALLPRAAPRLCAALLGLAALLGGCKAADQRIAPFAEAWGRADFARAEREIDQLVAEEAEVDRQLVAESRGLAEEIEAGRGDTFLFLLEKAMVRLAAGDLDACIDLMRRARDVMAGRWNEKDLTGWIAASAVDDAVLEYKGADYEHVLVPALLALVDLLEGGQDAYAYALQVGEVQERILGSTLGEDIDGQGNGYNPRKQYQRVAVGAYVEGLVREKERYRSEALKAYERAREWGGAPPVVADACQRATDGVYNHAGNGVVHVFYLGGRGPRLVQGTSPLTEQALFLANLGSIFLGEGNVGTLGQAPVPVPNVLAQDPGVPPLEVRCAGAVLGTTSTLIDVNQVARQQIEANMPWILARAAIRRTAKAVAAKAAQDAVDAHNQDEGWGLLAGVLTNAVLTIGERADTRNWTSLPAQLQAARCELPEGTHELDLGQGLTTGVRVAAGKDTYVVVLRPDLASAGVALVDKFSRVPAGAPAAAAPAEPAGARP
jgi:hypothetical protein